MLEKIKGLPWPYLAVGAGVIIGGIILLRGGGNTGSAGVDAGVGSGSGGGDFAPDLAQEITNLADLIAQNTAADAAFQKNITDKLNATKPGVTRPFVYLGRVTGKTPLFDKSGKITSYVNQRDFKLGERVKIGGKWYYPILGTTKPRFLRAGSGKWKPEKAA